MPKSICVLDRSVRITELDIPRKDVADFLRSVAEDEVEMAFMQAIEVGSFCLERARMSQDTEFVRRQLEQLLVRVEATVSQIPQDTQKALVEKIGTGNGQVLAPIKEMIESASRLFRRQNLRKCERPSLRKSIQEEKRVPLGKALGTVRNMLDPKRSDSVQSILEQAVRTVAGKDGALASAVKEVVTEAVKPISEELDKLAKEVRGREAAAEALEQTTRKGSDYELDVLQELQEWSEFAGAEIHYVGTDNRPGDILVKVPAIGLLGIPLTIVIEARDRQTPVGRKVISETLDKAMAERKSTSGIYLSKTAAGLGAEIGEWADGTTNSGPFVACAQENLFIALRWLIIQKRMSQVQDKCADVDATSIQQQTQRIRISLDRIKTINRKVTDVRATANDIQDEAEALRDEVKASLATVEDALKVTPTSKKSAMSLAGD